MVTPPRLVTFLRHPLTWILFGAFLLRIAGVTYGFPLFLVNDEPALVLGALKMIELKTLVPAWHNEFKSVLYYPPFASYFYLVALSPVLAVHYLASGAPSISVYRDVFTLDPSFLWVAARTINALLGVISIYLAYRIGREVTGSERAALLAALFLALSFYHLQLSHVVRHWLPAAALITAAWLASLRIRDRGTLRAYLAAGAFSGFAAGVNTAALVALVPAAVAHLARSGASLRQKIFSPAVWIMMATALVIFGISIALYPYGFTRGEGGGTVGGDIAMRFGFLAERNLSGFLSFLGDYARIFLTYETTLLCAAVIGITTLFRRDQQFVIGVFMFSFVFLLLLYLFFNKIPRAIIFLLPVFAVLAGHGVDWIISRLERAWPAINKRAVVPVAFAILLFAYPLAIALRFDFLLRQQDTRLVAREWIESNIPAGTKILMDTEYLRLVNTHSGIEELASIDPTGLRAQDRVLLRREPAADYPAPAFHVLNLHFISPDRAERSRYDIGHFRNRGFRYIVVEYETLDQRDLDPHTRELISGLPLVSRFAPFHGDTQLLALDFSGEVSSVSPISLFRFARFGQIVDVYAL